METLDKEWETELVKSKVRGRTLHVTGNKESLKANYQKRHYTIDTYTRHNQNRNSNFQRNFNDQTFLNRLGINFSGHISNQNNFRIPV